jgi:hypothetical protein
MEISFSPCRYGESASHADIITAVVFFSSLFAEIVLATLYWEVYSFVALLLHAIMAFSSALI